jgi:hypothetical protein
MHPSLARFSSLCPHLPLKLTFLGYGQTGPYRIAAGYDVVIEGEAGLMHMYVECQSIPLNGPGNHRLAEPENLTVRHLKLVLP